VRDGWRAEAFFRSRCVESIIDPCSSARWFQGWTAIRTADDGPRPTENAGTVLLRSAWQKYGFIHPGERPRAPS
jgi:hypothetical protein